MSDTSPASTIDEEACLESRPVHRGRIVDLRIDTVRFPDGSTGELEMVRHSGAAAVVPLLDPPGAEDPRLLLVRQYRYAAGGYILEIPAGRPDSEGEPWEEVAARELEEETGWKPGELRPLTRIHTTPGFTDEVIHIFLATGLSRGSSNHDQDEFLEVETRPLSEVLSLIRDGTITDAKTVCGVLYAAGFLLGL
jgi:ADP-ribose pyrophosphatase